MVQVKFKTFGSNTAFGGFSPGDVLRTDEKMAQHLIDIGIAVLHEPALKAPAPAPAPEHTVAPAPSTKRSIKAK